MNVFESELKKGRFVVGECSNCKKITWPPNEFCSSCFENLSWRKVKEPGTLIEFSVKDGQRFCLVEFENTVRVIGTLPGSTIPVPGQKIRIVKCGFEGRPKIVFAAL